MQPNTWGRVIALTLIVSCLFFSLAAAQGKGDKSSYAMVDFQKVSAQYKANEAFQGEIKAMQTKYELRLQRRDGMPFLTEEEHKSLDTLHEKATRTDAENTKMKDLEAKNKKLSDDFQTVRQKPDKDLTDADKTKLADTQKQFSEAQTRLTQLKENLTNEITQYGKSQTEELMKKFRSAVAKVAEQKSIGIVFTSEVVLYAGTDITDSVITEVNKK